MCTAAGTIEVTGNGGAFGFAIFDDDAEFCLSFADEDNQATTNTQSLSDNQAINLAADTGANAFAASFTSFASGQATVNFTATNGTTRKWPAMFLG